MARLRQHNHHVHHRPSAHCCCTSSPCWRLKWLHDLKRERKHPKGSPHTQQNCSKGCTSTQKHAETVYRCVQYSICIICINLFCMRNYVQISSQIDNCNMTWPRSRTCHTSCPWNCQKIHASVSFQVVEIQRTDCPTESYPVTKEPTWTCWQHLLVAKMLENHHLRFAPGVLVKSVSVSMVHLDATWCH